MTPRIPTLEEKKELLEYLISEEGYGMGTVSEEQVESHFNTWMDTAPIAVFDHFRTDSQGYEGKLMVVVANYHTYHTDVYIWPDNKIQKVSGDS